MEQNIEHTCFRDEFFLSANILTSKNVLSYFSASQFYDQSCLNEVIKMQTKYTGNEITDDEIDEKLKEMVGVQYILAKSLDEDQLFIIYKIDRFTRVEYDVLQIYYVLNGNIYQSPTNHALLSSRLSNSLYFINEAIDMLGKRRDFDCFKGFSYSKTEYPTSTNGNNTDENMFFYKVLQDYLTKTAKEREKSE
ncbi:hypothetical protein EDEG_04059 [Edhazardia aedis USNM 41457]|uniref:Mediator of RNA polymerase II transcription subunit 6 n=1 Tax=Edhazardia aedis (strain USNM 41457) TaxID=1003232 RepID=J9DF40_EDHAE|nr:hypothetical protein EDEG_04059 [Edhazardia aedis USNM 41457]|eukprot:EJW01210.1 hypothetical protein EDEG_04059 [Edhazardia aedis USNM 41457]